MSAIPFGNYELVERIGEGGMAEVWRARSRGVAGFEKTVVIKRLLPTLLARPGFAAMLVREAKIAARLSHPNIIQIFDLGEFEASYFIAMEYLEGRDLAVVLSFRAGEPLPLPLRLFVAAEVAKALDYAHRARGEQGKSLGLVHRDVSPQNVLLGFEGEVKVADFGIARTDVVDLGRGEDPAVLRGKFAYMSPEQARGEALDRRSDLFAFGILLYELVVRRRMYAGLSPDETLDRVRRGALPEYERRLPLPALAPILRRALAFEPKDRFDTAGEIHIALNRLLYEIGEPVGQMDLAREMHRMFPLSGNEDPNRLEVDLLSRALEDANAGVSVGSGETTIPGASPDTVGTVALPHAARRGASRRALVFLVVRARDGDDRRFDRVVVPHGGVHVPGDDLHWVAAFGIVSRERAAADAARCALEIRRVARLEGLAWVEAFPAMALSAGQARVGADGVVSLDGGQFRRLASHLPAEGEIVVDPTLALELSREYECHEHGDHIALEGYRSVRDRAALHLRDRAPLVGRRAVTERLAAWLVEAAEGRGRIVQLVGEPGVGKSRLIADLRATCGAQHVPFVQGRALEAGRERSFSALADLTEDLAGIEPEDAPRQRFEKIARLRVLGLSEGSVRLLGELIGLEYPLAAERRLGRPRGVSVALALRTALRSLSRDRVLVMALEDLQWMDDATRQVLPLLLKGLGRARVLVVLTRRPGTPSPWKGAAAIEVLPLDREATGRLLAHHLAVRVVDPDLASRVRSQTGGIPAWIEVIADHLAPRVTVADDVACLDGSGVDVPLPASLRALVAARLERLRARDRSMLRVVAAIEGVVGVRELAAIEGLIGHTERAPLRRLLTRRLLAPAHAAPDEGEPLAAWGGDEGDEHLPNEVVVPSDLLRRAVMAELDEGETARLHARIAATLARLGGGETAEGLFRLAHHTARSAEPRRASDYYVAAAEAAAKRGDHARAAKGLLEAATLLHEEGEKDRPHAFELGVRAAEAALRAGELTLAETALAPLVPSAHEVTPELAVRGGLAEARRLIRASGSREAARILSEVRPRLGPVPPPLRARVLVLLGRCFLDLGQTEAGLSVLTDVIAEGDSTLRGLALAVRAIGLARADRVDEAGADVNEALAIAARSGKPEMRFASLSALAEVAEARGEESAQKHREAAEIGLSAHDDLGIAAQYTLAAVAALREGDRETAASWAAEARGHATMRGHRAWYELASAVISAVGALEGDLDDLDALARAVDTLEPEHPGEAALAAEMLARVTSSSIATGADAGWERAAAVAARAGRSGLARRLRRERDA